MFKRGILVILVSPFALVCICMKKHGIVLLLIYKFGKIEVIHLI